MTNHVRIRVDPIACDGRGLCAELLPELISLDDWGFPIIRDVDLPPGLMHQAIDTVKVCPKLALRLEKGQATWHKVNPVVPGTSEASSQSRH